MQTSSTLFEILDFPFRIENAKQFFIEDDCGEQITEMKFTLKSGYEFMDTTFVSFQTNGNCNIVILNYNHGKREYEEAEVYLLENTPYDICYSFLNRYTDRGLRKCIMSDEYDED